MPAALGMYLKTRDWGNPWGGGWMTWPARAFTEMRYAAKIYDAWKSYTSAENRVEWLRRHPGGAEIVGVVKSYKYGEEEPETVEPREAMYLVLAGQGAVVRQESDG